jgi:E3 ubiquitin-protein ligase SHPRH
MHLTHASHSQAISLALEVTDATASNKISSSLTADMVVTAADLATADIVLTTFDVLRKDINFEADGSGQSRSSRFAKYPVFPTPLTRLRWWRVIVDEAQMIEGSSSKAAQMANHLDIVNRWCVTGTPISKGLEDIFGLVTFLQACTHST